MAGESFGYLIWGINDKTHELTDTKFRYQRDIKNEPIEHYLARNVSPAIYFLFDEDRINGKRVVVLSIPAARIVPTEFKDVRYIRIGSSKENIKKHPEREAALFRVLNYGRPSVLNTPSRFEELSFEQLFLYYEMKGIRLRKNTFKKNLELLTVDGKYNMLAQLLSLDKVIDFGDTLNVPQADERNRRVERKEVMLFNQVAYREAVINAFVHNSWVNGHSPMFTAFQNRIEITSMGTLPPGQTREGFYAGVSLPVNEKLAEIFVQLHISEKSGRGVPKIVEIYGEDAFDITSNTIKVTIPYERLNLGNAPLDNKPIPLEMNDNPPDSNVIPLDEESDSSDVKNNKLDGRIHERVRNDDAESVKNRIVDICTEAKNILEIMNELGYKDKKTVRKYLDPLVKQGRIAMTIPDKPTSRNQKYITIK